MPNYTLTVDGTGVLLDGAVIPPDLTNADYQAYLAWSSAGNSLAAAPELALAAQKAQAQAQVAAEADALVAERLPLSSDPFVFQMEHAEALAALDDPGPLVEATYPLLTALIDRLGADLDEVAAAVIARQADIVARVVAVNTKRSQVLTLIESQATSAQVLTVVQNIAWPIDAGDPNPL